MKDKNLTHSLIFTVVLLSCMTLLSYLTSLIIAEEEVRLMIYVTASPLLTLLFHRYVSGRKLKTMFIPNNTPKKESKTGIIIASLALIFFFGWGMSQNVIQGTSAMINTVFIIVTVTLIGYMLQYIPLSNLKWTMHGKYLALGVLLPLIPPLCMVLFSILMNDIVVLAPLSFKTFLIICGNALFYFIVHLGQLLREELTFRGYLVRNLAQRPVGAIILTGIIFGLWHTPIFLFTKGAVNLEYLSPIWMISAILSSFSAGTIFAYLYLKTGNLLIPTISHSIFDTVRNLFLWAPVFTQLRTFQNHFEFNQLGLNIGGNLLLLIAIILLVRLSSFSSLQTEESDLKT